MEVWVVSRRVAASLCSGMERQVRREGACGLGRSRWSERVVNVGVYLRVPMMLLGEVSGKGQGIVPEVVQKP